MLFFVDYWFINKVIKQEVSCSKCIIRVLMADPVRVTGDWLVVWDGGVPSGMVTCWGGPPPAAMESGQKR